MSHSLELDSSTLIPVLQEAEAARCKAVCTGAEGEAKLEDMEDEPVEEEGDGRMRNRKTAKRDNDFSDLLPVSNVSPFAM